MADTSGKSGPRGPRQRGKGLRQGTGQRPVRQFRKPAPGATNPAGTGGRTV